MSVSFTRMIPIPRLFDVEKAKEFYIGWLGFKINWEHQFAKNTPQYIQVSRGNLVLPLQRESRGRLPRINGLRRNARNFTARYLASTTARRRNKRLGRQGVVTDPFGNRIRFNEHAAT